MSYRDEVLADAPVSYYRLAEASPAGTAVDEQGVNAGTYFNSPTYHRPTALAEPSDFSIGFTAASKTYVRCKSGKIVMGQTNFTIEAWVKTAPHTEPLIYGERPSVGSDLVSLDMAPASRGVGRAEFVYRDTAGTLTFCTATTLPRIDDGNWHHVVVTKAGTAVKIYVDGGAGASFTLGGSNTMTSTGVESRIGNDLVGNPLSTGFCWNGDIDEVALYTTTLTQARVQAHYDAALKFFATTSMALSAVVAGAVLSDSRSTDAILVPVVAASGVADSRETVLALTPVVSSDVPASAETSLLLAPSSSSGLVEPVRTSALSVDLSGSAGQADATETAITYALAGIPIIGYHAETSFRLGGPPGDGRAAATAAATFQTSSEHVVTTPTGPIDPDGVTPPRPLMYPARARGSSGSRSGLGMSESSLGAVQVEADAAHQFFAGWGFPGLYVGVAFDQDGPHDTAAHFYDVSKYNRGGTIDRGRPGELDRYEAGTMTLRMSARDGALDPTNPRSPFAPGFNGFYPNKIVPMLQVVVALNIAGIARRLFTGFIEDYELDRSRGPGDLEVVFTCTDGFELLQLARVQKYYAPQHVDDRIRAAAADAEWPAERTFIATGNTNVQAADYGDAQGNTASGLEVMMDASDAELGQLYIDAMGWLTFWGRKRRAVFQSVNAIFGDEADMALNPEHLPLKHATPRWGKREMKNVVAVTPAVPAGTSVVPRPQLASDSVNVERFGRRNFEATDLLIDRTLAGSRTFTAIQVAALMARYLLWVYKRPELRVDGVTISPNMDVRLWREVILRELGDLIAVNTNHPAGGGVQYPFNEFFIEHIHHEWSAPFTWETSYETSPAARWRDFPCSDGARALGFSDCSSAEPTEPPEPGADAMWPLGDAAGLALDVSGNDRHLTVEEAPGYGTVLRRIGASEDDTDGGAIGFPGIIEEGGGFTPSGAPARGDAVAAIGPAFTYPDRSAFTLTLRVRLRTPTGGRSRGLVGTMGFSGATLSYRGWGLYLWDIDEGDKIVLFREGAKARAPMPPVGQWVTVACRYDGTNLELWVDGELVESVTSAGMIPEGNSQLHLGVLNFNRVVGGYWAYAPVDMDEVRLWGRALSNEALAREMRARVFVDDGSGGMVGDPPAEVTPPPGQSTGLLLRSGDGWSGDPTSGSQITVDEPTSVGGFAWDNPFADVVFAVPPEFVSLGGRAVTVPYDGLYQLEARGVFAIPYAESLSGRVRVELVVVTTPPAMATETYTLATRLQAINRNRIGTQGGFRYAFQTVDVDVRQRVGGLEGAWLRRGDVVHVYYRSEKPWTLVDRRVLGEYTELHMELLQVGLAPPGETQF